jgi:hypothetical protein
LPGRPEQHTARGRIATAAERDGWKATLGADGGTFASTSGAPLRSSSATSKTAPSPALTGAPNPTATGPIN